MILILGITLIGEYGFFEWQRMLNQKEILLQKNQNIDLKNKELYRRIDRLKNDPAYIESIARQELGMIGLDEVIITIDEKKVPDDG